MAALTFAVDRLAAATVLTCQGALVAASAMQLETALSQLLLRPQPRIVIDLAKVTAIDCTGVMMLRVTAGIALEQGGSLVLAMPATPVVHTLREGGTLSTIATYRTLESALAADPHGLVTDAEVAAQSTTTPWPVNADRRRSA
ncbi:STAS domain-containing protein [Dactylosporangium aurantiacum]|uniref:STAS domain-containing protein n=1 Tax=Dactylosporangium aurantiacum TaxID=35754 RepID=A0A9Q9IJQ7_9ACTN|nr:STAS domain-containing protein [Dactylosporangium aurantiacum]MDG6107804.1 STAS domain-containing protein [Dactylosporangium aurantiacum]UWZ57419.1 STAS domain-containing protein [Dactylosporangium aurantiacum]